MGKIDLLELQSRCKRDPAGYREDFLMQLEHFNALHAVFSSSSSHVGTGVSSSKDHENFGDLVSFISHVHTVYTSESSWFPSLLLALIDQHFMRLDVSLRRRLVAALILLRNRNCVSVNQALPIFLNCFGAQISSCER